jgi:hypothetical protein
MKKAGLMIINEFGFLMREYKANHGIKSKEIFECTSCIDIKKEFSYTRPFKNKFYQK